MSSPREASPSSRPFILRILAKPYGKWFNAIVKRPAVVGAIDILSATSATIKRHMDQDLAAAYHRLGNRHQKACEWDAGETALLKSVERGGPAQTLYFKLGYFGLVRFQHEKALEYFLKAFELGSDPEETLLPIAKSLSALGRLEEAADWCHRLIALNPKHSGTLLTIGYLHLKQNHEENFKKIARMALQRYPDLINPSWLSSIANFEERFAVREQIALFTNLFQYGADLTHLGDPKQARTSFARAFKVRDEIQKNFRFPEPILTSLRRAPGFREDLPTRILPSIWITQIGHIAHLDIYVRAVQLGYLKPHNALLLAPRKQVVNHAYLEYYRPYFILIEEEALCDQLIEFDEVCGESLYAHHNMDDSVEHWLDIGSRAYTQWDKEDRPPLLSLSESDRQRGKSILEELHLPKDAWFVCLHIRESSYYNDSDESRHRNATFESYLPAIHHIRQSGGWVIRMGARGSTPLPKLDHVIDYSQIRTPETDIDTYLCATARFFIGMASGPSFIPITFGTPALLTNWASQCAQPWDGKVTFMLKKIFHEKEGRLLKLDEMLDEDMRGKLIDLRILKKAGYHLIDNTPEEILEAVKEMLQKTGPSPRVPSGVAYDAWRRVAIAHPIYGAATPSLPYLERNFDTFF